MQEIVVSLIVPIYGVEQYISKFLEYLLPNLRTGVEVILVDDGAKDKSGIIAHEFAIKYSKYVTIIHKENGGLSSARNAGLEIAKGAYVAFPDPDDYLEPEYTKTIIDAVQKYNEPDMILIDYYSVVNGRAERRTVKNFKEGFISKEDFLNEITIDKDVQSHVWSKFIKRKFYEGRKFDKFVKVMEDALLLTDLCLELNEIVYIPKALYYYVIRESSLTTSASVDDIIKTYHIKKNRYEKYKAVVKHISIASVAVSAYVICQMKWQGHADIDIAEYEKFVKQNIWDILKDKECDANDKKHAIFMWIGIAGWYNSIKY